MHTDTNHRIKTPTRLIGGRREELLLHREGASGGLVNGREQWGGLEKYFCFLKKSEITPRHVAVVIKHFHNFQFSVYFTIMFLKISSGASCFATFCLLLSLVSF